ncbi:hypothetical protein BKA59DRAFT_459765 [Fusarium tricinctum]|uniref:Uncharacterized protein n=1 Tax=Fusarium tricinctum TaxID=61284 RepID=A0A8K0RNN2_9HYPO|nr:hypothetical protein BKA59DRAFT_459765 [Fusarium tricinctum]
MSEIRDPGCYLILPSWPGKLFKVENSKSVMSRISGYSGGYWFILCNTMRIKWLLIREQLTLLRTTDTIIFAIIAIILFVFLEEAVCNPRLQSAATNFHQDLLSHIQAVNQRRIERRNEFNNLQNSSLSIRRSAECISEDLGCGPGVSA